MKKLFIAATLLIVMVASAMVLSSFSEPKEDVKNESVQITMNDGWTEVGEYTGSARDGGTVRFVIWEKEGMCNQYYWVLAGVYVKNPDETEYIHGVLRQNRDGEWYAAYNGKNYYIDF